MSARCFHGLENSSDKRIEPEARAHRAVLTPRDRPGRGRVHGPRRGRRFRSVSWNFWLDKHGVRGAASRQRVLGSGNRRHLRAGAAATAARSFDDRSRESAPGDPSPGSEIIDAAQGQGTVGVDPIPDRELGDDLGSSFGDGPAPGGRADLIVHDAQLLALARQPQDGQQEILAAARIDPARPEDQAGPTCRLDGSLASELARPVYARRIRRVRLQVRLRLGAVEDVIGRIVDEQRTEPLRFLREHAGRDTVHRHGEFRLGFRLVHRRVGARIHDHVGPHLPHLATDRIRVRQDRGCRRSQATTSPSVCRVRCEFPPHLAVRAGHEKSHLIARGSRGASHRRRHAGLTSTELTLPR